MDKHHAPVMATYCRYLLLHTLWPLSFIPSLANNAHILWPTSSFLCLIRRRTVEITLFIYLFFGWRNETYGRRHLMTLNLTLINNKKRPDSVAAGCGIIN